MYYIKRYFICSDWIYDIFLHFLAFRRSSQALWSRYGAMCRNLQRHWLRHHYSYSRGENGSYEHALITLALRHERRRARETRASELSTRPETSRNPRIPLSCLHRTCLFLNSTCHEFQRVFRHERYPSSYSVSLHALGKNSAQSPSYRAALKAFLVLKVKLNWSNKPFEKSDLIIEDVQWVLFMQPDWGDQQKLSPHWWLKVQDRYC